LFVSLLHKAEDGQVALMMTPRMILNERLEFLENALAESLQRCLTKFAKASPIRFWHVLVHKTPRSLTTCASAARAPTRRWAGDEALIRRATERSGEPVRPGPLHALVRRHIATLRCSGVAAL
ncbi:MAG: hypothetical protein ACREA0_02580, partial [bacterium]